MIMDYDTFIDFTLNVKRLTRISIRKSGPNFVRIDLLREYTPNERTRPRDHEAFLDLRYLTPHV